MSVIDNCVEVVFKFDIFVIVDGGICYLGDVVKVLVLGVLSVMIGFLFVGIEELLGDFMIY